jgi:hypothetical protein
MVMVFDPVLDIALRKSDEHLIMLAEYAFVLRIEIDAGAKDQQLGVAGPSGPGRSGLGDCVPDAPTIHGAHSRCRSVQLLYQISIIVALRRADPPHETGDYYRDLVLHI